MRSLRNFLNKAALLIVCAATMICAGCAGGRGVAAGTDRRNMQVAVLPVENLSGSTAPLTALRRELGKEVAVAGLGVVPEEAVDRFLRAHRIRYTGGVDEETCRALLTELRADAVLVTSLELNSEDAPPKMALISRLVATGERSKILWMESIALAGDEEPGVLGLGLIGEPARLRKKVLERTGRSLAAWLTGGGSPGAPARRYAPKAVFTAFGDEGERKPVLAVLPFTNQSTRKNAGEITVLHCVKQLVDSGRFTVVEPGVVRNRMLQMRVIMEDGVALPQVDLMSQTMQADYLVTGKVYEYQDYVGAAGTPKVDFSLQVIDGAGKKVVWSSKSYNEGSDGVFFYDWGRTYTAAALAQRMTRAVVGRMLDEQ